MALTRLADFLGLTGKDKLSEVEEAFIEACRQGDPYIVGDGTRPETATAANTIRASLLRYLILGGCDTCRTATQGVQLEGAYVTGQLDLDFGRAVGQTFLVDCRFAEPIQALQTRFELLDLSGSACPGVMTQGAAVTGDLFLRDKFHATGWVSLAGAKVGGQLSCSGGRFENADGIALDAEGVEVTGALFLSEKFHAKGMVSLAGAKVGGALSCSGGRFENAGGDALNAHSVEVTGDLFLSKGFHATGRVSLSGAVVGGALACDDGRFEKANGDALIAEGVEVTGALFLSTGFRATGRVSLAGAKVGGQLACTGGRFENANGVALNAHSVEVTGALFLNTDFHAKGEVSLAGAKVGGQLACEGGHFENADGDALNGQRLQVTAQLIWRDVTVSAGCVDLSSASVGDLVDDPDSWPDGPDRLYLDGFTYGRISAAFTDATRRLDWLRRGTVWKGEFFPQPYRQLARVLHEMGHDRAARQVLMECDRLLAADQRAKDEARAALLWASDDQTVRGDIGWHGLRSRLARGWNWLIRFVAGYGYAPERTFYWAMGILTAGMVFFFVAWRQGVIVPNSAVILTSASWACAMLENPGAPAHAWVALPAGQHYETFYSLPYTFDILVPFVDIGQETAWSQTTGSWFGWTARVVAMGIEVAGWLISALGAAAITGLIRRDGD